MRANIGLPPNSSRPGAQLLRLRLRLRSPFPINALHPAPPPRTPSFVGVRRESRAQVLGTRSMAGVSRKKKLYIPLEGEEYVDYDNYDEDNPLGLRKYESKADERRRLNKKTKKKVIRMPQHDVDSVLAYTPKPFLPAVAELFPEAVAAKERADEIILDKQEWIRQQCEAKGYVEYEAEVTDSEGAEETTVPLGPRGGEEATAPQGPRGGEETTAPRGPRGGRRRFRHGVMKHAKGVKKLN